MTNKNNKYLHMKIKCYIFILLLSLIKNIYSQNKSIDSLKSLIKVSKNDTNLVKLTTSLILEYIKSKPENYSSFALTNYNKAIALSKKINYFNGLASANLAIHGLYTSINKPDSALVYLFKAIKYFEQTNDQFKLAMVYSSISRIYFYTNNLTESNKHITTAISYLEKTNNKEKLAQLYMSKAVVVQNIKDSSEVANIFFRKSIACYEAIKSNNLGILYCNYAEYLATNLYNPSEAITYFKHASYFAINNNDSNLINYSNYGLAKLYILQKKYKEATVLLEKSSKYYEFKHETQVFPQVLESLADSYYAEGDFKNCVLIMKKSKAFSDSLSKLANTKNIRELETKYNVEKKDKELLSLREKAIVEELEKEKQEIKNLLLLIGISILFVLGGFILYAYFNKQKANKLLDHEKKLVIEQKNVVELKNKEILDSIRYAKRIQTSLLPTDKYIERKLNKKTI